MSLDAARLFLPMWRNRGEACPVPAQIARSLAATIAWQKMRAIHSRRLTLQSDGRNQAAIVGLGQMGGAAKGKEPLRVAIGAMAGPFGVADSCLA